MLLLCPTCRRSFEEAGFCPFDGTPLAQVASPDGQTVESVAMPAAIPSTAPSSAMAAQPSQPSQPRLRAVSASSDHSAAIEALKSRGAVNEYDQLVGQTLDGRYYVERKLGEGGMGVVFAARHAVIERPLAIKVLKREVMRDTATIRRFVQEAKAASRIGHPNIVDVTDFGTTPDGITFSVMELVDGPTLGAAIRAAAPFPPARALKITAQIARALGAAHDKGIIHRDLKPENIFLVDQRSAPLRGAARPDGAEPFDRDGRTDFVKIVDFGIAKVTALDGTAAHEPRLTRVGAVFGTPEYMAPEQAAGRGDPDGRVDIYALGVILYEMLVGRVPHRGGSMIRTIAMQMLDPVEPPRKVRPDLELSAELESVVMRALAKKREDRYQTMAEVLRDIERVQQPIGVSLTGSPVYALAASSQALPEAADTRAPTVSLPTPADGIAYQRPISVVEPAPPRAKTPTGRVKHEPEFVARKPETFDHVFAKRDERDARDERAAAAPARRGPAILALGLLLGGAVGAVVVGMQRRSATVEPAPADAAVAVVEAAATVALPVPPSDAAQPVVPAPVDGGAVVVRPSRDAGAIALKPLPDGGLAIDRARIVRVQVVTKPERARLYQGHSYRGEGGVTLEEPYGTRLEVECRMSVGYKPGTVWVVFDGRTDVYVCELTRIKRCIDNIKNPFDDCELDPAAPADSE